MKKTQQKKMQKKIQKRQFLFFFQFRAEIRLFYLFCRPKPTYLIILPAGVAAGQPLSAGVAAGQPFSAGVAAGQPFSAGVAAGQPLSAGVAAGQPLSAGVPAGQPLSAGVPAGQHIITLSSLTLSLYTITLTSGTQMAKCLKIL